MKTAEDVTKLIDEWKKPVHGYTKAEIVAKIAEACLGWSYIFGARGQYCTPSYRRSRAKAVGGAEGDVIAKKCQVCNGKKSSCDGCKWYPGGKTRSYDCRGFTYWVFYQLGIVINGAGATSQYNNNANWSAKGKIADMPKDQVCCVFMYKSSTKKMEHTGIYIGNGEIIHCSGEVKKGKVTDKGWSHYAVPVGMNGDVPTERPTLRKGDSGQYVTLMQTKLIQLGYSCGSTGADGKFGKNTEAALIKFEHDRGMKEDGICGEKVWEALDNPAELFTVTVQHISKSVAEGIIKTYGGTMTKE